MIKAEHIRHLQERGKTYITDKKTIRRFGLNSGTWHKAEVIFYNCRDCEGKRAKGYLEIKAGSKWRKLKDHHTTIFGDFWNWHRLKWINITEGENDLFTAYSKGIRGICCFTTGAGVIPPPEKLKIFKYKSLAILYDQDKGGREGAKRLAGELIKPEYKISQIKVISLPVDEGKDLEDYFSEGHTAKELQDLIDRTTPLNHPNWQEQKIFSQQWKDKILSDRRMKRSKKLLAWAVGKDCIDRAGIYRGDFIDTFSGIAERWGLKSGHTTRMFFEQTIKRFGLITWKGKAGRKGKTIFRVIGYPVVSFNAQNRRKRTD